MLLPGIRRLVYSFMVRPQPCKHSVERGPTLFFFLLIRLIIVHFVDVDYIACQAVARHLTVISIYILLSS